MRRKIAVRYVHVNSVSLHDRNSNLLHDRGMKSIKQIRLENYRAKFDAVLAETNAERIQRFADKYGENPDYVRQILNGKGIGDTKARQLEDKFKEGPNWLDQDHSGEPQREDRRSAALAQNQAENDIDALQYAISALYAVIADERPAEGARIAAVLRRDAEPRFVENGLLRGLLRVLDRAAKRAKISPPASSAASRER